MASGTVSDFGAFVQGKAVEDLPLVDINVASRNFSDGGERDDVFYMDMAICLFKSGIEHLGRIMALARKFTYHEKIDGDETIEAQIQLAAHSIKGSASMCRFYRLFRAAELVEIPLKDAMSPTAPAGLLKKTLEDICLPPRETLRTLAFEFELVVQLLEGPVYELLVPAQLDSVYKLKDLDSVSVDAMYKKLDLEGFFAVAEVPGEYYTGKDDESKSGK